MFLEGKQHPVVILMGKILFQGLAVTKSAGENVFNLADAADNNSLVVSIADT